MSWIDELFGGGREQAGKDMYNQMQQGWGESQGFLNPYIRQGMNPIPLYNQWASSYQMSPEAQAQITQGIKGANNASAASGMLGSGAEQTAASNLSQSVRSGDFQDYMNRLFGFRQQGFNASNQLSQEAEKYNEDMAKSKAAQDEAQSQGITGAIGTGIGLFGNALTGGMFGGGGSMFGGGQSSPWLNPDTNSFYQQQPY